MQPGDVLLVRGHTGWKHPIDESIKLGEYLEEHESDTEHYSHVSIYIGNNWAIEAQGGRLSGKVRMENYEGDFDVGETDLSDTEFSRLMKAAEAEFKLPYDWWSVCLWIPVGILTSLVGHPYWRKYAKRKTRYCATFVNWAYAAIGMPLSDKPLPTPDDIARSDGVTIKKAA